MPKSTKLLSIVLAFVLVFIMAPGAFAQYTPTVFVVDQDVVDGQVVVARAVINGPGWIVIHADANGSPGPVIGFSPLTPGINANVAIDVEADGLTDILYAMLHVDEGTVGEYEFPGADGPVILNGAPITPPFEITGNVLTVVGTAMATEGFETLVTAIQAAGLVDELKGAGPFTVFAPTDDAFAALPAGTLDSLLADPDALAEILLYHVVSGETLAADISDGQEVVTLQGDLVTFVIDGDTVTINDATITATDIAASNGVIHVIDTLLLPPAPEEAVSEDEVEASAAVTETVAITETTAVTETEAMTETEAVEETEVVTETEAVTAEATPAAVAPVGDDIVETATAAGDFTTLLEAVEAANLVDALTSPGPLTVFAPTDAAFDALPADLLADLMDDPDLLQQVLLYHVVSSRIPSERMTNRLLIKSEQGEFIRIGIQDGNVTANDANVVTPDVEASNGIIHVIDSVLVPQAVVDALAAVTETASMTETTAVTETAAVAESAALTETEVMTESVAMTDTEAMTETESVADSAVMTETEAAPLQDIVATAMAIDDFSTLVTAVQAAGLVDALQGPGPYTVFAPTNTAFDALPVGALDALLADPEALKNVLFYHVVPGAIMAADITDGLVATTLQGDKVQFSLSGDTVLINDAQITTADILAANGVIHSIDSVILPPADAALLGEPAAEPTVTATEAPAAATAPAEMPRTGISFGSANSTLPVVLLVILGLFACAFVTRQRPA